MAYAAGGSGGGGACGGLHAVDPSEPLHLTFAGCVTYSEAGDAMAVLTHDSQCVVYRGPDEDRGKQICMNSNFAGVTIVDVTDPAAAVTEQRLGDSVAARHTLDRARVKTVAGVSFAEDLLPKVATAAVGSNPEEVATTLAEYIDSGGRDARRISRDPVFDRVRDNPAFAAEFTRLDEILARQRREVERDLTEEE